MDVSAACRLHLPALFCQHSDVLVYLAPSAALAVLISVLSRRHPVFFLFTVAGTICHELAHFIMGWLTGARPASLSIIPRRTGATWQLGSVSLTRVRWYNAAPAALAPFLILLIPVAVGWWRTRALWHFEPIDIAIAFALAPQFLSCWPSRVDWRVAARSWPYLILIGAIAGLLIFV